MIRASLGVRAHLVGEEVRQLVVKRLASLIDDHPVDEIADRQAVEPLKIIPSLVPYAADRVGDRA
jgi:hypothetical protein